MTSRVSRLETARDRRLMHRGALDLPVVVLRARTAEEATSEEQRITNMRRNPKNHARYSLKELIIFIFFVGLFLKFIPFAYTRYTNYININKYINYHVNEINFINSSLIYQNDKKTALYKQGSDLLDIHKQRLNNLKNMSVFKFNNEFHLIDDADIQSKDLEYYINYQKFLSSRKR